MPNAFEEIETIIPGNVFCSVCLLTSFVCFFFSHAGQKMVYLWPFHYFAFIYVLSIDGSTCFSRKTPHTMDRERVK